MVFDPHLHLPSSDELPCSDDTPVENEDQNYIPNFLFFLLEYLWRDRSDWFFGIDMGIYHTTAGDPYVPIIPEAFLCLGVERRKQGKSRPSYVVWEENNIVPALVLEIVSKTPGGEYNEKMKIYANLGVLYYIIYNPEYWQRDRHQPFEVYRLVQHQYELQIGEPIWMPEIGLGIGRYISSSGQLQRELLCWYYKNGRRIQTPQELLTLIEQAEQEKQRAEQAELQAKQIKRAAIAKFLAMGSTLEQIAEGLSLPIDEVNKLRGE